MQSPASTDGQLLAPSRISANSRIWLALVITLVLHALLLLLPLSRQMPVDEGVSNTIQVQLITVAPEFISQKAAPAESPAAEVLEVDHSSPPAKALVHSSPEQPGPEQMGMEEKKLLTNRILVSPYITEEAVPAQLFGKAPAQPVPGPDFHYPNRENMISLLSAPLPELPFDYQQGLIKFSYEPGAIGKMQRFLDVITPEFGWTTSYGTKVECVWVLVIVACGWGR